MGDLRAAEYRPTKRQWFGTALSLACYGGCAFVLHSNPAFFFPAGMFARKFWTTARQFRRGHRVTVAPDGIRVSGLPGVGDEWIPWSAVRSIEIRHQLTTSLRVHLGERKSVRLPAPYSGMLVGIDRGFPDKAQAIQGAFAKATGQVPRPVQRMLSDDPGIAADRAGG